MKSLNQHLNDIRPLAHKSQIKSGHQKKMAKRSVEVRKKNA